jgi:hypothetical protein
MKGILMEDIERYGDYNEIDEAPGGNKNPVAMLLKALILFLCFTVVGVIIFRVILFSYYPKAMKTLYYNDTLTAYYNAQGGELGALTQTMRAPYDDPDFASFMADNLIVIKGAGQLQLSVRYNSSVFDAIEEKYGIRLDKDAEDLFTFELERVPFDSNAEAYKVGELSYVETDSKLMYTYYKLVFDGVEFYGEEIPDWLRLKITLNDVPNAEPYYILVYECTEQYCKFSDYKLSGKEIPNG